MNNKIVAVIVAVVVIALALPLASRFMKQSSPSQSVDAATPDVAIIAADLVSALSQGDFKSAYSRFDGEMQAAMPLEKLEQVWNSLTTKFGPFKQQLGTRTDQIQGHDVVFVACEFERGKTDFQIAINTSGKIDGLYLLPPKN